MPTAQRRGSASAPPPVRPLSERARDVAGACGACGALTGACLAAQSETLILGGALYGGTGAAALGGSFVALRHGLLQGRWEQDREGVSGLAAGVIGLILGTARGGRRVGAQLGIVTFFGGCGLHYAHRWWLHWRLTGDIDLARTLRDLDTPTPPETRRA